jgi:hypothetical protein
MGKDPFAISGLRTRLGGAVLSIMQSTDTLQERLLEAFKNDLLIAFSVKDRLPTDLREQVEVVFKTVTRIAPTDKESSIEATTRKMSDPEACSVMEKILIIYDRVREIG